MILNRIYNYLVLKRKHVTYGSNFFVSGIIVVHGSGKITLGNDVSIHSSPNVNPVAGGSRTHLFAGYGGGCISIGNHVGISHSAITAYENIVIEDNVLIGSNCMISDTDFHSIEYYQRMERPDLHVKTAPVHIGEGAFIGARSIILKGVHIGKHAVVGAGSVVTRSVSDNEVWAGNPARFIRNV